MPYQIECRQTFQSPGKRWVNKALVSSKGYILTVASEDEARTLCNILSPNQPYILSAHEFDAPSFKAVEGGATNNTKSLGDIIVLLGQEDYFNTDGTPKTPEEIYGETNAAWIRGK